MYRYLNQEESENCYNCPYLSRFWGQPFCSWEQCNFPHEAIRVIKEVLKEGRTKGYKAGEWRKTACEEHQRRAIGHLLGPATAEEDHLAHALCRLAMAVAVREQIGGDNDDNER